GWAADDEPYYYAAQVSALTVDRNVATVDVLPGAAAGAPAVVRVQPLPAYLEVENRAQTGPRGSAPMLEVTRARARNRVLVSGSVPLGSPGRTHIPVTVEEPEMLAGGLFRRALGEAGVAVEGETARRVTPPGARVLTESLSRPLCEILPLLNKPSDNLIA